jgi:hypothetical protein
VRPTVVYIHGNGNKARKETLKAEWDRALFGTDMGAHSIMAYWAALRYPEPLPDAAFDEIEQVEAIGPEGQEGVEPTGIDPTELLAETLAETDGARAGAMAEVVEGAEGPEDAADASAGLDAWLLRMGYTAEAVVAGEDSSGLEVLPLPRAVRIATFRALLKITFKDVYAYFFGGFREPMRAVLREALTVAPDPVVVISHSLGTIIAYDVLREAAFAAREIPLFVTAGSPLGVTEVQDLVVHDLEVPAGVAAWRNIADARDLVALDSTLRPEYAPKERCADFLVVNDSANHHGIREYLSSRPVQESVRGLFA